MPIAFLGGTHFRGEVGQPLPEDLVVQVKDENGKPIAGKVITFTCIPAGSLTLGTERQATDTTKADGTARIRITGVRTFGPNVVRASVEGTKQAEHAECTVEGYHPQVEVRQMPNGQIVAIRRPAPPPPPTAPLLSGWPLAVLLTVLVAAFLIGALGWKALNAPSQSPAPSIYNGGGGGGNTRTTDDEARDRAVKALARAEEVATGLQAARADLENRPTDHEVKGYVHGYVAPMARPGLVAEAALASQLPSGSPTLAWMCRHDPDMDPALCH